MTAAPLMVASRTAARALSAIASHTAITQEDK